MSFLTKEVLDKLNFKSIGDNVLISDKCSIYNPENISIGSNVRIDDFCILSAGENGIYIGNYVHIACYVSLIGKEKIEIGNYCGISSRTSIYSSNDDYSGEYLFGPMVEEKFKNVINLPVKLSDYSIIGSNCIILPGVLIGVGVSVGAFTFVNKNLDPWLVYIGIPAKKIKERSKNLLNLLNLK